MKDIALIRSMTNKEGNHQRATYQLHTGYVPTGIGQAPDLRLRRRQRAGRPQVRPAAHRQHRRRRPSAPASWACRSSRSRSRTRSSPPATSRSRSPTTASRGGWACSSAWRSRASRKPAAPTASATTRPLYRQTAGMVLSPRMKAFDLEGEDPALRDAYGQNPFGQGCLLARRLVEAGVTFVEVRLNGWDTHKQTKDRDRQARRARSTRPSRPWSPT